MKRWLILVCFLVMGFSILSATASAELPYYGSEDLFYNYYVPPVGAGSVGAQMYLCPRPTPPLVGHTYITYQPLMPHEFLWRHRRSYVRNHADGSRTYTRVRWH
ncbi:MAG: hypothetical protein JXB10_16195 [Pirellulales bacterium]|nr:hypothetical protein [Pirellulales bacterium]